MLNMLHRIRDMPTKFGWMRDMQSNIKTFVPKALSADVLENL